MNLEEITTSLQEIYGEIVEKPASDSWQIQTDNYRLLVLLSEDESWLRILIPIISAQEALPYLEQLMKANFDQTQEARYAIHENVLWAVFQHARASLTLEDFESAVGRVVALFERGLSDSFNTLVESQIREIIKAAKRNGQTLEATMQNLQRFYEEGLMGDMEAGAKVREETLGAWRYQLQRLWSETE